jgi:hypothetical protein
MVRKKNGKWRMCTDFIEFNKCCPKDNFPLARIDQIVDTAVGIEMMALLDYFFRVPSDLASQGRRRKD